MEIVTTLPSDKSLGYFRMSLTGHHPLPTGSLERPTNSSILSESQRTSQATFYDKMVS